MKDLTYYKTKLEQERETIINELKDIGVVKDPRNPDDWQAVPGDIDILPSDSNEVGDKLEAYEENSDLVQKLERQLTDVDAALQRIASNTYGICEIGKEPIEEERLEANPSARTCKKHINARV